MIGATIHGVGGKVLLVRKPSPGVLPASRFGGPQSTKSSDGFCERPNASGRASFTCLTSSFLRIFSTTH
jgi:hypothetical protein